jgi:hypothetical protein
VLALELQAEVLCAAREPEALRALFERAGRDLDALELEPAPRWLTELRARATLGASEAEVLRGLLERAAEAVRSLDGTNQRLPAGSQRVRGRLVAGPDPLGAGFLLESDAGPTFHISLRELGADDLAALLMAAPRLFVGADDELALALLRYHDGELAAARSALRGSGPPAERALLHADLVRRVEAAEERAAVARGAREARARALLASVEELTAVDPDGARVALDALLREHSGLPLVAERQAELRTLQRDLRAGGARPDAADVAVLFGAGEVSFPRERRVRMEFHVAAGEDGAWVPGSWADWIAPSGASTWEDLLERPGPSLELTAPLVLEDGPVACEVELVRPAGEPPALVVLSLAGVHGVLVGAGLPGSAGEGALLSGEPLDELLARARAGELEPGPSFASERFGLRLELDVSRRRVRLELRDGEEGPWRPVAERLLLAAELPSEGVPRAVLRAWEPLRLERAAVEASTR